MQQAVVENGHQVISEVGRHYGIQVSLKALPSYIDLNFLATDDQGVRYVVKLANPDESVSELDMQNQMMDYLEGNRLGKYEFPVVYKNRHEESITAIQFNGQRRYLRLLSFVSGVFYSEHPLIEKLHQQQLGVFLGRFARHTECFDHQCSQRYLDWDLKQAEKVITDKLRFIEDAAKAKQITSMVEMFRQQVMPFADTLPQQVIHNDVNDYNLLLSGHEQSARIHGVIDFGDMLKSWRVNELAIAASYALLGQPKPIEVIKTLLLSYHQENPLTPVEVWVLFPLICTRLSTSVCNSAKAYAENPENDYLLVSAQPAWQAIDLLLKLDSKSVAFELQCHCRFESEAGKRHNQILAKRSDNLFKTLSVSYQEPLLIERGQGQFLLDDQNLAYLDMVNNVCHVGHCHPAVVRAGQEQMAMLNTNTRYLHPNIVEYSEALLSTFPEELSVVMLVNSGSEANELAMRLMKCFTGSEELLVVDGAYHGNTNKAIEISPYKFNGPGGEGAKDNIHIVPMPDPYRGQYKGMEEETGQAYARQAANKIKSMDKPLGGFICESLQGVGGNLIMPDGYLKDVYQAVREAGGLCIADEVQVGFGRVGSHWWAFETQGVVPDIVTLGKPIANGHPMGAVVTTRAVADAFVTGMEYFNTFGGNPVSCAIGKSVLDTIEKGNLKQNAIDTGEYLLTKLKALQKDYPLIGDVRGLGLFIGLELVLDEALTPATEQAQALIEYMKKSHILLSLDGPLNNVMKIKPPVVFNRQNVDYFIECLKCYLDSN
ncbi:aminotransferase class III-fold pyridoxal phosphate-dependent enzyme [Endozoicomonas arenosclerae]|uniref:aminotransferase class III-fold pyridoxal phosphate-dependent enzyme n=1 Tax=Endozoicomonas arenosclerae TaxID=1633495 RepID=UPI000781B4F0|nr:aminotransferase class III-fold pyridoxal phosphate-dependent enzyme [Endozoicomonas arenosclerae]